MKRRTFIFLVGFLCLGGTLNELSATGALFVRPLRSNTIYEPVAIKTYDATVTIQDQIAESHVDQVFFNHTSRIVEATFIFPLPKNAVITELVYWFNGQRFVAEVRERQEAQQAYNEKIRQLIDPALLQEIGDNLFKLNIAPINPESEIRFEVTYVELLPYEFGNVDYTFLLKTTGLSRNPLERVSVNIDLQTGNSFKRIFSPSHQESTALRINGLNDKHYVLTYGDENFLPDRDLTIRFETLRENVGVTAITYTPTIEDSLGTDSFYALWITPPDSVTEEETLQRNLVFTADVSSSMEGKRLVELKAALIAFLEGLSESDRFNIITFGTTVVVFREDLVVATESEISAARSFVTGLGALGLTNIDQALEYSIDQSFEAKNSNTIIFLTDGMPTWGETDVDKILENARTINSKNIRIFPFGIGEEISEDFLIKLARENRGFASFIDANSTIQQTVANLLNRISRPVLSNVTIEHTGLQLFDRFPAVLEDLFWGSQVFQFGRYAEGGNFNLVLKGELPKGSFRQERQIEFTSKPGGNRVVARLWANTKIEFLLEKIALFGEQEELINAVIDLSIRFGILTPYTALYSDPTTHIREETPEVVPSEFTLHQNYPNPFNPETKIVFEVPAGRLIHRVTIQVFDLMGRLIRTVINQEVKPGRHEVFWNGKDNLQNDMPSGTYLYRLQSGDFVITKKMVLMR